MSKLALTMFHALGPLALVDVAIASIELSKAVTQVVLPLAVVVVPVGHGASSLAVALVLGVVVTCIVLDLSLDSHVALRRVVVLHTCGVLQFVVAQAVIEIGLSRLNLLLGQALHIHAHAGVPAVVESGDGCRRRR